MKVVFAATEVTPYVQTGGLGDVAGGFPGAFRKRGHDIRLIVPFHRAIAQGKCPVKQRDITLNIPMGSRNVEGFVLEGTLPDGVQVYFIGQDHYFDRQELYDINGEAYPDNAERFLFFSKAVLEVAEKLGFSPDIVHCNEWHTGLVPLLLASTHRQRPAFTGTRSVFSIHNMEYQGVFDGGTFALTNLPQECFHPNILEAYGAINLLKAGIVGSDKVSTVSPRYASEILTSEYGGGLDYYLTARKDSLVGILNGVDYSQWNPEEDTQIAARYDRDDLTGKQACRDELMRFFELQLSADFPIVCFIARMVSQKGLDILLAAFDEIMGLGVGMVVLGKGELKYYGMLSDLQKKYPERMGLYTGFDELIAHKMEAGSDIFVLPSRFEPCGLNQIYSMRYGTIPLVRATGGLVDTVVDHDECPETATGFKFTEYSKEALARRMQDAVRVFKDKASWHGLMRRAMAVHFSWDNPASQYEQLYLDALSKGPRCLEPNPIPCIVEQKGEVRHA